MSIILADNFSLKQIAEKKNTCFSKIYFQDGH